MCIRGQLSLQKNHCLLAIDCLLSIYYLLDIEYLAMNKKGGLCPHGAGTSVAFGELTPGWEELGRIQKGRI